MVPGDPGDIPTARPSSSYIPSRPPCLNPRLGLNKTTTSRGERHPCRLGGGRTTDGQGTRNRYAERSPWTMEAAVRVVGVVSELWLHVDDAILGQEPGQKK